MDYQSSLVPVLVGEANEQYCKDFIKKCDTCQKYKLEIVATTIILSPLPIPHQVWQDFAMDFIMGLPKSEGKIKVFATD